MPRSSTKSALGKRKRSLSTRRKNVKKSRSTNALVKAPYVRGLTRNDFGFPDRIATKLIYADAQSISITAGNANSYSFRLNGLQDPDWTGYGHQPQWFDQFGAVYRNYRVKGAKITVKFFSAFLDYNGHEAGPYLVGITTSNQNVLNASSVASLTETPNGVNDIMTAQPGQRSICTLSNTYTPMRDLGLDPYESEIQATVSANPNTQFFAHVWAKDMGNASNTYVQFQVKIEYQVEFFNRIEGVLS